MSTPSACRGIALKVRPTLVYVGTLGACRGMRFEESGDDPE